MPAKNRVWWSLKISRNKLRDRQTTRFLRWRGWTVIRIWEHASVERATERIIAAVGLRRA